MVFGFGKHETDKDDLDKDYYKRRAIYLEAKEKERERMAGEQGIIDAQAIRNKKPFYQKVIGVGMAIGRDLTNVNPNPDALFSWGTPQQPKRKRRRKRSRAR